MELSYQQKVLLAVQEVARMNACNVHDTNYRGYNFYFRESASYPRDSNLIIEPWFYKEDKKVTMKIIKVGIDKILEGNDLDISEIKQKILSIE